MSWMSEKTGRPKEDGGHQRIDISVDEFTFDVLQDIGNKSKFIEHTIHSWMQPQRLRFHEPKETANDNSHEFKDAAVFVWPPNNSEENAILSIRCHFQYRCGWEGFRFRVTVNDSTVMSSNGWLTSIDYTSSPIYSDCNSGSQKPAKIFPNQSNYTIKFQFKSRKSFDTTYVKDINVYIEVADGMPAQSP